MALTDLTGCVFGRLTVIKPAPTTSYGATKWQCICSCGAIVICFSNALMSGASKSCGCVRREKHFKHGSASRDGQTPEYRAWNNAISRCHNTMCKSYPGYGGRGITVCDEWRHDFQAFLSYIGKRPSRDLSLDRIDGSKGYMPGNVRWATRNTQARNRAFVKLSIEKAREMRAMAAVGRSYRSIAVEYGVDWSTVRSVVRHETWKEVP